MLTRIISSLHNKRQWRPVTVFQACQQNNVQINESDTIYLDIQSVWNATKK